MHGFMSMKKVMQLVQYRHSLENSCPHCNRIYLASPDLPAMEPSPLALSACEVHSPRVSLSANEAGEGENDNLIMKE